MQVRFLLSLSRLAQTHFILWSGSTHTFYKIRCLSVVLRSGSVNHSPSYSVMSPYSVYVVSEIVCTALIQTTASTELTPCPISDLLILLECIICFPCLSEYRHQPIPALHILCTTWNITFISMICHFRSCPRLFRHNTCRISDGSAGGWPRTWAGIYYANVGGVTISDPDCYATVCVMF